MEKVWNANLNHQIVVKEICFNIARCKVATSETKSTSCTCIIELVFENKDTAKNRRWLKVIASAGILSAGLRLNGVTQCWEEEHYQVEVEGVCAHLIINYCDSAVFKADTLTLRRIWNTGKISKHSRMIKDAPKH